jgi:hypothetical protein
MRKRASRLIFGHKVKLFLWQYFFNLALLHFSFDKKEKKNNLAPLVSHDTNFIVKHFLLKKPPKPDEVPLS